MKIVTEIPKSKYLSLKKCLENGIALGMTDMAILNGKVIPEGHGRLIDVDKMISDFVDSKEISIAERFKISNIVEHQKVIIEANKEGAENGAD